MKKYEYILFDLDGTLTDPGLGITNSVMYALRRFGIPAEEKDRTSLYRFIGPPLLDSFREFYGFSDEDARRGIQYYREYYKDRGIFENRVYPGIDRLLQELRRDGRKLLVATSKPEAFAREILRYFKLDTYFTCIAGATMDEKRVKKADIISDALKACSLEPKKAREQAVMVGDRRHDVEGAKANGLNCVGVLFGYGSLEELKEAGADEIAETIPELAGILRLSSFRI